MKLVTVVSFFADHDGYGSGAQNIWSNLLANAKGIGVRRLDLGFGTDRFAAMDQVASDGLALAVAVPASYHKLAGAEGLVGVTMQETTRLAAEYVKAINARTRAVIVPSEWNKAVFEDSGVTVPIHIASWGINAAAWPIIERALPEDRPYRFLWSGTPDTRKGWDLVYRAFRAAFNNSTDVELVMHFRKLMNGVSPEMFTDPNVTVIGGVLSKTDYRQMLSDADAFVYPSRGEGFGLMPREAAATGMPVVATNWGGMAKNNSRWATFGLSVRENVPAAYHIWKRGQVGDWAEPDFDHLVYLFEVLHEHRRQVLNNAALCASWMHTAGSWAAVGREMRRAVEALA